MKTKRLTQSAMLLAIAIVLELLAKLFIPELPFGGQITLASMLPIVLISYREMGFCGIGCLRICRNAHWYENSVCGLFAGVFRRWHNDSSGTDYVSDGLHFGLWRTWFRWNFP